MSPKRYATADGRFSSSHAERRVQLPIHIISLRFPFSNCRWTMPLWIWCLEGHMQKLLGFTGGNCRHIVAVILVQVKVHWKSKLLQVEGRHVPQYPIAGDANVWHLIRHILCVVGDAVMPKKHWGTATQHQAYNTCRGKCNLGVNLTDTKIT